MNKTTATLLVPVAAGSMMLTACGGNSSSSSSAAATSTSTTAATTAASDASSCPTSNTRAFAKTRFVTDVALAGGTFHRYIYKPYQAGTFQKGASGRTSALVKAGAVALIDTKLIDNAYKNVQANPTLCKVLITPLGQLKSVMGSMKGQILTGNLATIGTANSLVKQIESAAGSNGAKITESDSLSDAQKAESNG